MRSWTRTLNLEDAHALLALARPGTPLLVWERACHRHLGHLSTARRRELIRIVREEFLTIVDLRLQENAFLRHYDLATDDEQRELVCAQWALSHPLSLATVAHLVQPALDSDDPQISLARLDTFVAEQLDTDSAQSLGKTRRVLVKALEDVGCLGAQGTGRHRTVWAQHGEPSPALWAYLEERGGSELPRQLTACRELAPPPW